MIRIKWTKEEEEDLSKEKEGLGGAKLISLTSAKNGYQQRESRRML